MLAVDSYLKYLIEGLSYSFEEDGTAGEEKFAFSKRKIGDVIDILSNIGPVSDEIEIKEDDSGLLCVEKTYLCPTFVLDQTYNNWIFDDKFYISSIQYYIQANGKEFIVFVIFSDDVYYLIYNITERKWHDYDETFFNKVKSCDSIWNTICDIIKIVQERK